MASYTLTEEFQLLNETSGVIVNSSNVRVEISASPVHGTGAILHPHQQISFNDTLYAARAPSDCGVAVIGVIKGGATPIILPEADEQITPSDIASIFGASSTVKPEADEYISYADVASLFGGSTPVQSEADEYITYGDIASLFNN